MYPTSVVPYLDLRPVVIDALWVGILSTIKSRLAAPRRNDYYGRGTQVRRVPAAELAAAEAVLSGGGPLAERFATQLRDAPHVWRLISDDGSYELRISTTAEVRGVPRAGWRSERITVHAQPGDRPLELWLDVTIAGIVGIHGRSLDGQPWPAEWSIDPRELDVVRAGAPRMALPTPAELRVQRTHAIEVLETWLGEPGILRGKRGMVAIEPPVTAEAAMAFEQAQDFALPDAYRDLLLVANGFEVGSVVVLGTNDAYRLDMPGPDRLVIAPPNEDGALVLAPTGEVRFVQLEDPTSDGRLRAPDLRQWLRQKVRARPTR